MRRFCTDRAPENTENRNFVPARHGKPNLRVQLGKEWFDLHLGGQGEMGVKVLPARESWDVLRRGEGSWGNAGGTRFQGREERTTPGDTRGRRV